MRQPQPPQLVVETGAGRPREDHPEAGILRDYGPERLEQLWYMASRGELPDEQEVRHPLAEQCLDGLADRVFVLRHRRAEALVGAWPDDSDLAWIDSVELDQVGRCRGRVDDHRIGDASTVGEVARVQLRPPAWDGVLALVHAQVGHDRPAAVPRRQGVEREQDVRPRRLASQVRGLPPEAVPAPARHQRVEPAILREVLDDSRADHPDRLEGDVLPCPGV
jgi:hypothetical protein